MEQQTLKPAPAGQTDVTDVLVQGPLRLVASLIVPFIGFLVLWQSFVFMRDSDAPKGAIAVVALIIGVFGIWFLYWATNEVVERLPIRIRDMTRPYIFVGPAMVILFFYLLFPAVDTLLRSFQVHEPRGGYTPAGIMELDEFDSSKLTFDNFTFIVNSSEMRNVLKNNVLWIVVVTSFSVGFGLLVAVLVDRIGLWEPVAKAFIFLPMAISAVGASVIWRFMYFAKPADQEQIGFINKIAVDILGMDPISFMQEIPINNYALMVIMIWLVTGFCMVILSAAVKGVPGELLEAGRMDGANEFQVFFSIIVPYIRPTIVTVSTTILIMVLKVFDIVFVMTNGRRGTEVVANRMYNEFFKFFNQGRGSALAMFLLIAVFPIIVWNIRDLRKARN